MEDEIELNKRRKNTLAKLDKAKFSWFHVRVLVVNGVGFFTDAYDIFVINFAMTMMGCIYFKDNGNTVPIYIDTLVKVSSQVGALIGQILFGILSDRKGRKKMYGVELTIIVIGTVGSALSGNLETGMSVFAVLAIWRVFLGIGLGGDYPLSAVITSEFASTRHRGAMIASVFAMQGFGILTVCLVTLIFLSIFKSLIYEDQNNLDYVWRFIIGFGCIPALLAIYFRLTISETPRYTIEIHDDIEKATKDVDNILNEVRRKHYTAKSDSKNKASLREFSDYFRQWKNFKVLLGTSACWFCLDVAFYGINLNTNIIMEAIGFSGNISHVTYFNESIDGNNLTETADVYSVLFNNAVGNIIIATLGLIPGYWVCVFTIDRIGRKPIQLGGFLLLAIILAIMAGLYNLIKEYSITWFVIIFTVAQFFLNFGPNTTTFVIPSEVFTTRFRATAHGISSATGKLGAVISQVGFLQMKDMFGEKNSGIPILFGIFSVFMLLGFLFTFLIPETKGLSLEEISEGTKKKSSNQSGYQNGGNNDNRTTHF